MKKLHKYQLEAREWIINHPRCGVFMEMGLGKTITTLSSIYHIKKANPGMKTLIIGPKRVAENVWDREIENWNAPLTISVIKGNPKQRAAALKADVDIHVIGIDNVTPEMNRYDMVVIDELSMFKNSNTKRFKTVRAITKNAKRVIGLTGTPTPNNYLELWSEMFLIDGGEALGKYKKDYIDDFFRVTHYVSGSHFPIYGLRRNMEPVIQERLKKSCISFMGKDWLASLPEKIEVDVKIRTDEEFRRSYKTFKEVGIAKFGRDIVAPVNSLALLSKLMQYSSGFMYDDDGKVIHLHNEKINALKEIVESSTSNVLIAYTFQEDLKRLREAFPKARIIDKREDLDDWNAGKIEVALLHPKSGGHGLNLQEGGSTIVWYSPTFSLEERAQFNARLHRQGQKKGVVIHTLILEGTVEEEIMRVINRKDMSQTQLMESLRNGLYDTVRN